jgi:hypothetical protein
MTATEQAIEVILAKVQQTIEVAVAEERERCAKALADLLDRYVELVVSGDCGNWNPEKEPEVVAARAVLSSKTIAENVVQGAESRPSL